MVLRDLAWQNNTFQSAVKGERRRARVNRICDYVNLNLVADKNKTPVASAWYL